jgi:hypothetical protein
MNKEELIALGLTEELADKMIAKYENMIPKNRFDTVNEKLKKAEADLKERDTQIEGLKNADMNIEEMKKQIEDLQLANQAKDEEYQTNLKKIKIDAAIETSLVNAKAKDIKTVKKLLELDKIELKDDSIIGLDEQIKLLTENEVTKSLFNIEKAEEKLNGFKPVKGNGNKGGNQETTLGGALDNYFSKIKF